MERGEIGVSYLASGELEIVEEKEFHLVDRALQQGDIVKRNIHDSQSGVVLDTKVEVKVEHAVSQMHNATWVSSEGLSPAQTYSSAIITSGSARSTSMPSVLLQCTVIGHAHRAGVV